MIRILDSDRAPRMAPALLAIRGALVDGQWWPHQKLIDEAQAASDLALDTIKSRIAEMVAVGLAEKRGRWTPQRGGFPGPAIASTDTREYRLIDWPLPE